MIITIVGISSYQIYNSYLNTLENNEREKLQQDLRVISNQLEQRKIEVSSIAGSLAKMPLARKIIYDMEYDKTYWEYIMGQLQVDGIEIRDFDFESVARVGNVGVDFEKNNELKQKIVDLILSGVDVTFFTHNDKYIQVNAVSSVIDEFRIPGLGGIMVSKFLGSEFIKLLPFNDEYGVQLYYNQKLIDSNQIGSNFNDVALITSDIENTFNSGSDSYLICKREINGEIYSVGYLPIKNFFGKPIGYIVLIQSRAGVVGKINDMFRQIIINSLVIIGISSLFVLLITQSITHPLNKVIGGARQVSQGDLRVTIEADSKDQFLVLSDNFNQMVANLKNVVSSLLYSSDNVYKMSQNLSASVQEVSATSEEVAATSEKIALGAEEQATKTKETEKLLDNIKKGAEDVSESSAKIVEVVDNVQKQSIDGLDVIKKARNHMGKTLEELDLTNEVIDNLRDSIDQINTIIEAINYINEETTLLSFNAAIEAARAGEAGRGFAIVAEEIRSLANRSNESLDNIISIFRQIKDAMQQVEDAMDKSRNNIKSSDQNVVDVYKALEEMQNVVEEAKNVSIEIAKQARSQLKGTEDIDKVVGEITDIAEDNLSGSRQAAQMNLEQSKVIEEVAEAADDLADMAESLQNMIKKFKL